MRTAWLGVVLGGAWLAGAGTFGCAEPYSLITTPDSGMGGGLPWFPSAGRAGSQGGAGGMGGASGAGGSPYVDARAEIGSALGDGSLGTGVPADTAVIGAAPDVLPPDTAPAVPIPPDAAANAVVRVTACAQINCPQLTALATSCDANDSSCEMESPSSTVDNFCHDNGVKKQSTRVYSGPQGMDFLTTMRVKRPDGSDCYTLTMSGNDSAEVEYWVFKNPSGQEVARGEWNNDLDQLTLICGGVRYLIDQVGCPGTDGEPAPDQCDEADEGDCEFP